MGEVFLCPQCRQPVDLRKTYLVTNRATARTKHNRVYAHLNCVMNSEKPIHEMSDMELNARIKELEEKLRRPDTGSGKTARRGR